MVRWCLNCSIFDKQNASKDTGKKSPIEVLCPIMPVFQVSPKVFGCTFFVHVPKHQQDKLDPKAVKCVFVGYPSNQKGYKCYAPGKKGRIFVTMDVSFYEDVPFYSSVSEDLIHGKSKVNSLPLLDFITPPIYPGSINETDTKVYVVEEQREIDNFKEPL